MKSFQAEKSKMGFSGREGSATAVVRPLPFRGFKPSPIYPATEPIGLKTDQKLRAKALARE